MNMTLPELTYLIVVLNQLVDGGAHAGVTIDEVEDHIDRGDLFAWMRKRFAGHRRWRLIQRRRSPIWIPPRFSSSYLSFF
jgi:hypothetical protein